MGEEIKGQQNRDIKNNAVNRALKLFVVNCIIVALVILYFVAAYIFRNQIRDAMGVAFGLVVMPILLPLLILLIIISLFNAFRGLRDSLDKNKLLIIIGGNLIFGGGLIYLVALWLRR